MNVTVTEVFQKRNQLEYEIQELLIRFEKETNMKIDSVVLAERSYSPMNDERKFKIDVRVVL